MSLGEVVVEAAPDVVLGGTDWFLVMTDLMMARHGTGAVCHLVVDLAADAPDLPGALGADAWWASMRAIRLTGWPPLSLPRWRAVGEPGPPFFEIGEVADDDALVAALPRRMALRAEPGVRLSRAWRTGAPGPSWVLSWHHGLLDARTAERTLQRLGGDAVAGRAAVAPVVSLAERVRRAWRARNAVYASSVGQIGWITPIGGPAADRVRRARLSEALLDGPAQAAGAAMLRGSFHMAAAARAVAALLRGRGVTQGDVLITAPQDQRRGAVAPIGNGITVLFYRVPVGAVGDVRAVVQRLTDDTRAMLRDGTPVALMSLLDLCRWLPARLYAAIVRFPTWGRVATVGVSDTGDTLGQLVRLGGVEVVDARHIPANLHPPGVMIVFSRQRGALDVVLRYRADRVSEAEADALMAAISADLTGQPG